MPDTLGAVVDLGGRDRRVLEPGGIPELAAEWCGRDPAGGGAFSSDQVRRIIFLENCG